MTTKSLQVANTLLRDYDRNGRALRSRRGKEFVTLNACNECKRKKAKCDGKQPCVRCIAQGSSTCEYEASLRVSKETMQERIGELELHEKHCSRVLQALAADADPRFVLDHLRQGKSLEVIYDILTARQSSETKVNVSPKDTSDIYTPAKTTDSWLSTHSIQEDHLYDCPEQENQIPGKNFDGVWTTITADVELVKHLHSLYFCWEYPIFAMPMRDRFIQDRENGQLGYCSPLLVNVLAALGCRFSDRPEVETDFNGGEKFYSEAERLWDMEQTDSSLTTIQATALMSLWEASHGRDGKGFFYGRQAICMAVEMGLHKHPRDGPDLEATLETASATFWGTFILDQIWSLCLGHLPHFSSKGHSVLPPILTNKEISIPWEPYTDKGTHSFTDSFHVANDQMMFRSLCELSKVAYKALYYLYSPREAITSHDVMSIYSQYLTWYSEIQRSIKTGENSTPTALFTHMYYHFSILLLFGPFTGLRLLHYSVVPHDVCIQAADAIGELIHSFRELYSLRRTSTFVPYISLASSIVHIALAETHGSRTNGSVTKALQGISDLYDMTPAHVIAVSGRDSLRSMANQLLSGAGWSQSSRDHNMLCRSGKSILPRNLTALESSIFAPYSSQILARAEHHEQLRNNGFELLHGVG